MLPKYLKHFTFFSWFWSSGGYIAGKFKCSRSSCTSGVPSHQFTQVTVCCSVLDVHMERHVSVGFVKVVFLSCDASRTSCLVCHPTLEPMLKEMHLLNESVTCTLGHISDRFRYFGSLHYDVPLSCFVKRANSLLMYDWSSCFYKVRVTPLFREVGERWKVGGWSTSLQGSKDSCLT